jgi:hypothetical protein
MKLHLVALLSLWAVVSAPVGDFSSDVPAHSPDVRYGSPGPCFNARRIHFPNSIGYDEPRSQTYRRLRVMLPMRPVALSRTTKRTAAAFGATCVKDF